MALDSGGRRYNGFPRTGGVRPAPDWPLSHEEKKRAALRLYDRDVRAADCLIRSGEEKCRELQLQLQAARAAKHDEEVAERLRLAIESATLALNVLLSAAGNGQKVGAGHCPTLEMVPPKQRALAAPTRARSEGSAAEGDMPRGALRRQSGSSSCRPHRRVSFSDDHCMSNEEWAEDCPTGGDEPEPPDPSTPEHIAVAASTETLDAPLIGAFTVPPMPALLGDGQPLPQLHDGLPAGLGQSLDQKEDLSSATPRQGPSHSGLFEVTHVQPLDGVAPPSDGALPPSLLGEAAPAAAAAGAAVWPEGAEAAEALLGPKSPDVRAGPVCFSIATPRSPSDSPAPSPPPTPRLADAAGLRGPNDVGLAAAARLEDWMDATNDSSSSRPPPPTGRRRASLPDIHPGARQTTPSRRWTCQRGRTAHVVPLEEVHPSCPSASTGTREPGPSAGNRRGCTPPLRGHQRLQHGSRRRHSCGSTMQTPREHTPEAAAEESQQQPAPQSESELLQHTHLHAPQPRFRRQRTSRPRRQSSPQAAEARLSGAQPSQRARGVQLFDPSQIPEPSETPVLAIRDATDDTTRRGVRNFI